MRPFGRRLDRPCRRRGVSRARVGLCSAEPAEQLLQQQVQGPCTLPAFMLRGADAPGALHAPPRVSHAAVHVCRPRPPLRTHGAQDAAHPSRSAHARAPHAHGPRLCARAPPERAAHDRVRHQPRGTQRARATRRMRLRRAHALECSDPGARACLCAPRAGPLGPLCSDSASRLGRRQGREEERRVSLSMRRTRRAGQPGPGARVASRTTPSHRRDVRQLAPALAPRPSPTQGGPPGDLPEARTHAAHVKKLDRRRPRRDKGPERARARMHSGRPAARRRRFGLRYVCSLVLQCAT